MAHPTAMQLSSLLKLPAKIQEVTGCYLLSLALPAPKHTQSFASEVSGLHQSQFSRLLSNHGETAIQMS